MFVTWPNSWIYKEFIRRTDKKLWIDWGVCTPSPLRKYIFTVLAKDNIDFNVISSTAAKYFHGTSMTVMQFPSHDNVGNDNIMPESTHLIAK